MKVFVESNEYGLEYFRESEFFPALLSQVKRLAKSAAQCFKDDGIVRRIGIEIGEEESEEESNDVL